MTGNDQPKRGEDAPEVGEPAAGSKRALICWALYDWANSSFPTLIQTFVFAAYFTEKVARNNTEGTAMWGNMLSLSAILIALGGPVLGAVSDQTGRRKPWLAWFTALCCLSTLLLWFVKPSADYVWLALVLVALGTMGEEYSSIFYNAMLPRLAPKDQIGRWSGWGWALGYAGGLSCLAIALWVFVKPNPSWFGFDRSAAEHVRATFVLTAVWFGVFSLPLLLGVPDTPGDPRRFAQAARAGVAQLWESVQHVRQYAQIVRFLIARMIYTDALSTMFAFGGVFAAGAFNMSTEQVLLFGISLNVTAGLGAAVFAHLDDWIGSKRTIMFSLVGLIGFGAGMLLARHTALFWVCGLGLGIFVGPVQAASRSLLAHLAPEHLRNQMFGLYAFSGKATSFLGPLLVGWGTVWSGSQRLGMSSVIAMLAVGFVLLWPVRSSGEG